ncbi:MAG: DUF7555 family protein [Halobacteriota archaeon]
MYDEPELVPQRHIHRLVDATAYVVAQSAIWTAIGLLYGLVRTEVLRGLTLVLFFAGMGLFLIGVIKLRPESAVERRRRELAEERGEEDPAVRGWLPVPLGRSSDDDLGSPLEQVLAAYPPVAWLDVAPSDRFPFGVKLFSCGLILWAIAYLVERLFVF